MILWRGRGLVPAIRVVRLPVKFGARGLITVLALSIESIVGPSNLVILDVLAVVSTAMKLGRRAAIISAVSIALLFDYFFVLPYRSFVISDTWYLIMLIGFLAVGLIVSMLMLNAKEEARKREP